MKSRSKLLRIVAPVALLVVTVGGALVQGALTSVPASAITPTIVSFQGETLALTADGAPANNNFLRATFVVQHDPGVSVASVRRKNNSPDAFTAFTASELTVHTLPGGSAWSNYSVVQVQWVPGTGNWPDFGGTRKRTYTAEVQLRMSTGLDLAVQSWAYNVASQTQRNFETDFAVIEDAGSTVKNVVIPAGGTFRADWNCDDADASGTNDNCNWGYMRLRNLATGSSPTTKTGNTRLECTLAQRQGTQANPCENGNGPDERWNADDGVTRQFNVSIPYNFQTGLARGRYAIEMEMCGEDNCTESNAGWQQIGSFYYNPAAPTLPALATSASAGTFARPNTGATVTVTANPSDPNGAIQVMDWDLDNNATNGLDGFEVREYGTPTLTGGQLTRTVNTNAFAPGTTVTLRGRARDNGGINGADPSAAYTGTQTATFKVNTPPTITAASVVDPRGGAATLFDILVADTADGLTANGTGDETLTLALSSTPAGVVCGAFVAAPSPARSGRFPCSYSVPANAPVPNPIVITATVSDSHNGVSLPANVSFSASNSVPVGTAVTRTVARGTTGNWNLSATDANGDTIDGSIANTGFEVVTPPSVGTLTCNAAGACSFVVPAATPQGDYTYEWRVRDNVGYSATVTETISVIAGVNPSATAVSCTTPFPWNDSSTCTVTVTDPGTGPEPVVTPTGAITLSAVGDGTASFTSCVLAEQSLGVATCTSTFTATLQDTYTVTASVGATSQHLASSGSVNATMRSRRTSIAVSCSPQSVAAGSPTTCTATVNDVEPTGPPLAPQGTVTFGQSGGGTFSSTTCSLGAPSGASSSCSVSYTPSSAGNKTVSALFSGSTSGNVAGGYRHGSVSSTQFPVTATGLVGSRHPTSTSVSCSPTSVEVGSPTSCTATVTDTYTAGPTATPTGTVTWGFSGGGSFSSPTCTLAQLVPGQSSSCSVNFTPSGAAGNKTVNAVYNGTTVHVGSSSGSVVVVATAPPDPPPPSTVRHPTSTGLSCTSTTVPLGTPTTCTATVTDTDAGPHTEPTGTVTWGYSGGGFFSPANTCTLVGNGDGESSSCSVDFTPTGSPGNKTVNAVYNGTTAHKKSVTGSTVIVAT